MLRPRCPAKLLLALALLATEAGAPCAGPAVSTDPIANHATYQVFVNGANCGFVRDVTGGACQVPIHIDTAGAQAHPNKTTVNSRAQYEDFVIQFAPVLDAGVAQWINESWDGTMPRRSVRIICMNETMQPIWDRTLDSAAMTQVVIPGSEQVSNRAATFAVSLSAGSVSDSPAQRQAGEAGGGLGQQIVSAAYVLTLDGLDQCIPRQLEPVTIKAETQTPAQGGRPRVTIAISDLRFTVPYSEAASVLTWVKSFTGEKEGTLTCVDAQLKPAFALRLHRVGARGYEYTQDAQGNPAVRFSLYCEDIDLEVPQSGSSAQDAAPRSLPKAVAGLNAPRKLGALEFTLKTADYSADPRQVGDFQLAPTDGERLFVISYDLRNTSDQAVNLTEGTVRFVATTTSGSIFRKFYVGIGNGATLLSKAALAPQDVQTFTAFVILPPIEETTSLTVTNGIDGSSTAYEFPNPPAGR